MTDAWQTAANLGNILIRRGVMTQAQVALAVQKQREAKAKDETVLFGQVCIAMGFCSKEMIEEALAEQEHLLKPACNESAVDAALDQLDSAVRKASKSSTKLAKVTERTATSSFAFTRVRD